MALSVETLNRSRLIGIGVLVVFALSLIAAIIGLQVSLNSPLTTSESNTSVVINDCPGPSCPPSPETLPPTNEPSISTELPTNKPTKSPTAKPTSQPTRTLDCTSQRPCSLSGNCVTSDACLGQLMCEMEDEDRPHASDEDADDSKCGFGGDVVLASENKEFRLVIRWDGNLVLFNNANMVWAAGTSVAGTSVDAATQSSSFVTDGLFFGENNYAFIDGVVFVKAHNGTTIWQSNTTIYKNSVLQLSNQGLLAISGGGGGGASAPVWTINKPDTMRASPNGQCTFGEQSPGVWVLAQAITDGRPSLADDWQDKWEVPVAGDVSLTDSTLPGNSASSLVVRNETGDIIWVSKKTKHAYSPFAQLVMDDNCDLCLTVSWGKVWCGGCSAGEGFQCDDTAVGILKCTDRSQCKDGLHCVQRAVRDGKHAYCRSQGPEFCSDKQQCLENEGVCKRASHCMDTLRCRTAVCRAEGSDKFCTTDELCGEGQGHCNSHNQCEANMRCLVDATSTIILSGGAPLSRCRQSPGPTFCKLEDCGEGAGQCFSDSECQGQLVCNVQDGLCNIGGDVVETSSNGFRLVIRRDGNLVIFEGANIIWASGSGGNNNNSTPFTKDNVQITNGIIVVVAPNGTTVWESGTSGGGDPIRLDDVRNNNNTLRASLNGRCVLRDQPHEMQLALLYAEPNTGLFTKWSINTSGGSSMWRESDGNLIVWTGGSIFWQTTTAGPTLAQLYVDDICNLWIERRNAATGANEIVWTGGCASFDSWRCAQDESTCVVDEQCELGLDLRCSECSNCEPNSGSSEQGSKTCRAPGHIDWCVACEADQGGCRTSTQCLPGLHCVFAREASAEGNRRCRAEGHEWFCDEDQCALGQGNCKSNNECQGDLVCASEAGISRCALPGPTTRPSMSPSVSPNQLPTRSPSVLPTVQPIHAPTSSPSYFPTIQPSSSPSRPPSLSPSHIPTKRPTERPFTSQPSMSPSMLPSHVPSYAPTTQAPSNSPSGAPSLLPTSAPTRVIAEATCSDGIEAFLSWKAFEAGGADKVTSIGCEEILPVGSTVPGTIPPMIRDFQSMTSLVLARGYVTGTLPPEFFELTNLQNMFMFNNSRLTGTYPSELGLMSALVQISFEITPLSGTLPHELTVLTALSSLSVWSDSVTGTLPTQWANIKTLTKMRIRSSPNLVGKLPTEWGTFPEISSMDMREIPGITGTLPSQFANLSKLTALYLQDNVNLTGSIPQSWGHFRSLNNLNIQRTSRLTGQIPSSMQAQVDAGSLVLSSDGSGVFRP